jgi:hypothetical protein
MEWLTLLLLVPAVVVPVVLLWGFAGCDWVFKLDEHEFPEKPVLEATPISVTQIELTWVKAEPDLEFDIHRSANGGPFELIASVPDPPFTDPPSFGNPPPLEPGVTYNYQVFAIKGDLSEGSDIVSARPLAFHFDLAATGINDGGFGGDCIVQRIGAALLKNWGTVVAIHVRGATDRDLTIGAIHISRVARPGAAGNPTPDQYDSDVDITLVTPGVLAPINTPVRLILPGVYTIAEQLEDLLIAFDISDVAGQGRIRRAPLTGATAFTRNGSQQAALQDRSPNPGDPGTFNTQGNEVFLLEKIEVL